MIGPRGATYRVRRRDFESALVEVQKDLHQPPAPRGPVAQESCPPKVAVYTNSRHGTDAWEMGEGRSFLPYHLNVRSDVTAPYTPLRQRPPNYSSHLWLLVATRMGPCRWKAPGRIRLAVEVLTVGWRLLFWAPVFTIQVCMCSWCVDAMRSQAGSPGGQLQPFPRGQGSRRGGGKAFWRAPVRHKRHVGTSYGCKLSGLRGRTVVRVTP